jgi:excinuclease ABC subunit A
VTGKKMVKFTEEQIINIFRKTTPAKKLSCSPRSCAPAKATTASCFEQVRKQGYTKVRVDGEILDITPGMQVDRYKIHDIEIVVDRLKVGDDRSDRLSDSMRNSPAAGRWYGAGGRAWKPRPRQPHP